MAHQALIIVGDILVVEDMRKAGSADLDRVLQGPLGCYKLPNKLTLASWTIGLGADVQNENILYRSTAK